MTEEMIYPGDPRHPCPICGGRSDAMHMFACAPVPLSEAFCDLPAEERRGPSIISATRLEDTAVYIQGPWGCTTAP